MALLLSAFLVTVTQLHGPEEFLLLGRVNAEWLVLRFPDEAVTRVARFGALEASDAAISRDGRRWAVVTRDSDAENTGHLYLLDNPNGSPRLVPTQGNVADAPYFSADGEYVYFVSNDYKQKRWAHQPMLYAQVYRVHFKSGALARLSLSPGCHLTPRPRSNNEVVFAHTNCRGLRGLQALDIATGRERELLPLDSQAGESAVSHDGRRVFYVQPFLAGVQYRVLDLATGKIETWGTDVPETPRYRPNWDPSDSSVFLQNHGEVWRLYPDGKRRDVLAPLATNVSTPR